MTINQKDSSGYEEEDQSKQAVDPLNTNQNLESQSSSDASEEIS